MRIAFRVDASAQIGTGHVYRCLALAEALSSQGVEPVFIVRDLGYDVRRLVRSHSDYPIYVLPRPTGTSRRTTTQVAHASWAVVDAQQDAEETAATLAPLGCAWVVVDHYGFDSLWHSDVRRRIGCRIAVIDDLADRRINADLIIDHNLHPDHEVKYRPWVDMATKVLGGPRFALIRSAYETAARWNEATARQSIGIFVGGSDPLNLSLLAWEACREKLEFAGDIEIVTTTANPHLPSLRECTRADCHLSITVNAPHLAPFFGRHLVQMGAGGGAIWERCCIGAPTVAVMGAENQVLSVPALHEAGILAMAGNPRQWNRTTSDDIAVAAQQLLASSELRRQFSEKSGRLVDGHGASRVAREFK